MNGMSFTRSYVRFRGVIYQKVAGILLPYPMKLPIYTPPLLVEARTLSCPCQTKNVASTINTPSVYLAGKDYRGNIYSK